MTEQTGAAPAPARRPLRVVLVDDSPHTRARAVELLLSSEGVVIAGQASDGNTGLALLQECQPDLLILDLDMPGVTGLNVLETIQRLGPPEVVIMLTGFDHPKLRQRCAQLGANHYFSKSTEFEKIVDVCEEMLRKRSGTEEHF